MAPQPQRFIGLDIHKDYLVWVAVDERQNVLQSPRRVNFRDLSLWMNEHLQATDAVVLEACSNAWTLYDQLAPRVCQVTVAHAAHVKWIASSLIKTDKRDALVLARLLAANLIPPVWVPPPHVRELRALIHHRCELVEQRRAVRSRLRALLYQHNIHPPAGKIGSPKHRSWWDSAPLSPNQQLIARQNLDLLDHLIAAIDDVEHQLAQLSVSDQWCDQVVCLLQLSGIGLLNAMTILSAIGDITRFANPKKLAGYSGLGVRVYSSGDTHRSGRITKAGRPELRTAMIEAAWVAVQRDLYWQQRFDALAVRRGKGRAIVAIARKLLVVVWHVLSKREADRHADLQAVARRLMRWGAYNRVASSLGLKRTAFVRRELDRLQIGQSLETLRFSGRLHRLPPPGTVPLSG
jgi:transposase